MPRILMTLVATVVFAVSSTSAFAQATTYTIDNSHTSLIFAVSHMGFSDTYGRFNKISGTVAWDASAPAASKLDVTIDANTIDTNDAKRDDHLKNADFFNVKQFPLITFKSTKVVVDGEKVSVTGDMTMHGVTKPVTLSLTKLKEGATPFKDVRIGFRGTTTLKRSDFGMNGMQGGIGDEIAIMLSFEAIKK
ncbi:YceI family protein [Lacunimicrobium album]